jgi:hypothetical protein
VLLSLPVVAFAIASVVVSFFNADAVFEEDATQLRLGYRTATPLLLVLSGSAIVLFVAMLRARMSVRSRWRRWALVVAGAVNSLYLGVLTIVCLVASFTSAHDEHQVAIGGVGSDDAVLDAIAAAACLAMLWVVSRTVDTERRSAVVASTNR